MMGALELKEEGNVHFKNRRFADAAQLYGEAEAAAPEEAVYSSNLSAAFYELGDYYACYQAIRRAIRNSSNAEISPNLFSRLSLRIAKALTHGVRCNSITTQSIEDGSEDISRLQAVRLTLPDNKELLKAWSDWDRTLNEMARLLEGADAARSRLARLPISKKSADPFLEYYSIGHDDPMSIIDDWGPQAKNPLKLSQLAPSRLSHLAFLFGGVGDARHVFGSIIGLHKAYATLDEEKKSSLKVHLTMLDIHPTALARDLCILVLLNDLMSAERGAELETEIKATLFYVYTAVLMPAYCHERFHGVVRRLLNDLSIQPPQLPSWIYVTNDSVPGIIDSLKYWDAGLSDKSVAGMLLNHSEFDQSMGSTLEISQESVWYTRAKVFIPPTVLCKRHGNFQQYWCALQDMSQNPRRAGTQRIIKQIEVDINTTWHPNSSLFDISYDLDFGYPDMNFDPFHFIRMLEAYNKRFKLVNSYRKINKDCPSFSVVEIFFDAVLDALKTFAGRIKLEILQGDLSQELMKIRRPEDRSRPTDFPRSYTRMWLSNVPDYVHGPLNTAVYVVPSLENEPGAAIGSNCWLNKHLWKSGQEFCHTYTLLSIEEVSRFLGCRVAHMDPVMGIIQLDPMGTLPRPLKELATHEELETWLTRVLLYTLVPGTPHEDDMFRVLYPNNLAAFFGLLLHLTTLGFPSHWISEFLRLVLSDSLVTDVAPYIGKLPVPISKKTHRVARRKINLDPWLVDFETIIATAYEALPFQVFLPDGFTKSVDEIGAFEVHPSLTMFVASTAMCLRRGTDPVMALMFYKPGRYSADDLAEKINEVLEGRIMAKPPGRLHIITVVEIFDAVSRVIRWRMSKERVRKMREDGWVMVAYRFDGAEPATKPLPASLWADA